MPRGRKPDAPGLQAAKGNPGKRRRKQSPDARAAELAAAPGEGRLSVPTFLARSPKLAAAVRIWKELAPDLQRYNLLETLDRYTFAQYCVHMADWIAATRDIAKRGHSYIAKNVNGDALQRLNPSVRARELAEKHILEIGARFGLDPSSRYKLLRDQAVAPLGGLFGADRNGADPAAGTAQPVPDDLDPVGLMTALASPAPGTRPN